MKNNSSVLIIYNPNAMKGKVEDVLPRIKQRLLLRYSQVDTVSSPLLNGAKDLAFKYAPKYDMIVSCGGDGTLHNVINGVAESGADTVIGILPFGTCNDVARTLNIPKDVDSATDCLLRANEIVYDIMYDGSTYIAYSLATGYLTGALFETTEKSKKHFGRFAYVLSTFKYLFRLKALPITLTCDGEKIHDKFVYFMLINGENAGGFKLNKGEDLSNGKIKLVAIKKGNWISGIFNFAKLFLFGIKSIRKAKSVVVRDVKEIEIENHSNAPFVLDGEKFKFLKKKISVKTRVRFIQK